MRIVEIIEATVPLGAAIGNASIDFRQMTTSAVALITDVKRDGRLIVGFGFGGIGRYGQGEIIRTRLVPRLISAPPGELLTADGSNLSPERLWAVMMRNEKPGGHGDRAHAVGAIDMAVWDATAKIAGMPLNHLLARHRGGTPAGRVFVYAAGGYYGTDKGVDGLRAEMQRYLDAGFGVLKIKIAGAPLAEDLRRPMSLTPCRR